MTTQRDRLAALLRDIEPFDYDPADWADALLARGVRVVDADVTEAARCLVAATDDLDHFDEAHDYRISSNSERDALSGAVSEAWYALRAALDGESRTENGTETTSDAEDDEGPVRWIWNIPRKEPDR